MLLFSGLSARPNRVRSQWVRISAHPRVDPGELGWLAMEEARYGLYQDDVGRSGVETAGLFERQDPLHPAIAFGTDRAQRTLAPQHPKAQRPVTVDGGIAPSTSASKPCVPLSRHTAPQ